MGGSANVDKNHPVIVHNIQVNQGSGKLKLSRAFSSTKQQSAGSLGSPSAATTKAAAKAPSYQIYKVKVKDCDCSSRHSATLNHHAKPPLAV